MTFEVSKLVKLIFTKLLQLENVPISSVIYFVPKIDKLISFSELQLAKT